MNDRAIYVISVAATLAGMHPQTLRQYDRLGIVSPSRAAGRGRRYSARDIARLREVQRLSQEEGINLAGIKRILDLERDVERLRGELAEARRLAGNPQRVFTADAGGEVVSHRRGIRPSRRRGDLAVTTTTQLVRRVERNGGATVVLWRTDDEH